MTEAELYQDYKEELTLLLGSTQMIKFAYGLKFGIHGFDIPEEFYPLETSRYLVEQYKGCEEVETWVLALWGGTAIVQLQESHLFAFGVEFDTWSSEKRLLFPRESFCSEFLVGHGIVISCKTGTRCTQCGKPMEENTICIPCFNMIYAKYNIQVEDWATENNLKLDGSWIWTDFELDREKTVKLIP